MPRSEAKDPALYADASPIEHVRLDAPPFFIINGKLDALVSIEEVRPFVTKLKLLSTAPVVYAELQASHGFDSQHSLRTEYTVNAIQCFLEWAYSDWLRRWQADGIESQSSSTKYP